MFSLESCTFRAVTLWEFCRGTVGAWHSPMPPSDDERKPVTWSATDLLTGDGGASFSVA